MKRRHADKLSRLSEEDLQKRMQKIALMGAENNEKELKQMVDQYKADVAWREAVDKRNSEGRA